MDAIDRQAAIEAVEQIRYRIWEVDIPSPTIPEYIEHHEQMQELLARCDSLRRQIEDLPSVQPEPQTCCGYDVNKLIVFATACRQQGVENGDLKAFANNCIFAWNVMSGEIAKTIEDIMRGQSDG